MAGTADEFSTRLPLDSPNWLPVHDVVGLLCRLTANRILATRDLTAELVAERVRSMRRCFGYGPLGSSRGKIVPLGPDRELLAFSFWADHYLESWSDRTYVRCDHRGRYCYNECFVFYVWKPDLTEIWPTVFGQSSSSPPSPLPPSQEPPQQPQLKGPQPIEAAPAAPKPEKPQLEELKPPPCRVAKTWVPYAIKQWPQEKDEDPSDYIDRLLRHAPKSWARKTIQNLLSKERKPRH
jgi:hypothetical protein